jgi:hypothetical protein
LTVSESVKRESSFGATAAALSLASVAVFLWETREFGLQVDDAFISFRYARNLAQGSGLVYNAGEYVEGVSNLSWTLLVAMGMALGFEAESTAHLIARASGVACLLATGWYAALLTGRDRNWLAAVAPLVVLSSPAFGVWATSGLETPLITALSLAALAADVGGRQRLCSAVLVFALLTRPDAALLVAAIYGMQLLRGELGSFAAWRGPIIVAAALTLLTLFRLWYFGSPLPNTFYAKVGGIPIQRGVDYVLKFFGTGAGLLLVPVGFAVYSDARARAGALFVALTCLYLVAIGGDAFRFSRFLLPGLAVLAALGAAGATRALRSAPLAGFVSCGLFLGALPWNLFGSTGALLFAALWAMVGTALAWRADRRTAAAVACTIALIAAVMGHVRSRNGVEPQRARAVASMQANTSRSHAYAERLSAALALERPPPKLIAALGIGVLGFRTQLPLLDLLGLTEPAIARSAEVPESGWLAPGHQRSNARYVMAREPDWIFIQEAGPARMGLRAELALHAEPDFERRYVWDKTVHGYRRRPQPD